MPFLVGAPGTLIVLLVEPVKKVKSKGEIFVLEAVGETPAPEHLVIIGFGGEFPSGIIRFVLDFIFNPCEVYAWQPTQFAFIDCPGHHCQPVTREYFIGMVNGIVETGSRRYGHQQFTQKSAAIEVIADL